MKNRYICLILVLVAAACVLCACYAKEPVQTPAAPVFTDAPTDAVQTTAPVQTTVPVETTAPTTVPTEATTVPTTEATTVPTEPTTVPTEPVDDKTLTTLEKVAKTAKAQVGKDYELNSAGPDTFDTSGLVYYCFAQHGIKVPRYTRTQVTFGTEVAKEDLIPGDVVFFWNTNEGKAEYVGIYVGGGKFVAARSAGKPASEMNMTGPYFTERFVTARRFYNEAN